MQKRTLELLTAVSLAALLLGASPMFIRASDQAASAKPETATPEEANPKSTTDANPQVTALKQQMVLQQKQIEQMQKTLEEQKRLLERLSKTAPSSEPATQPVKSAAPSAKEAQAVAEPVAVTTPANPPPHSSLGEVASTTPIIPQSKTKVQNAAIPVGVSPPIAGGSPNPAGDDASPLQLRVGDAYITPVGFMDFTGVWRNRVAGGNIGTSFGSIPYATVTNGITPYNTNLSETRESIQNSRIGFRVDALVKDFHIIGYMEADFLGTPAALNIGVSNNAQLLRNRLYWADLRKGSFEVLGGQTWTLMTPGRTGISPLPSDVFYTQVMDVNYVAGLVWGRIPELRFVYHPSKQVALALAIESPDQYAGGSSGGGSIVLPSALSGYSSQLDFGASSGGIATPNDAPDIIAKVAFDPVKQFHIEIAGIERHFKVYNPSQRYGLFNDGRGRVLKHELRAAQRVPFA